MDFGNAIEMQFIATNAPKVFDGYLTSLDSFVQVGMHSYIDYIAVLGTQLLVLHSSQCQDGHWNAKP